MNIRPQLEDIRSLLMNGRLDEARASLKRLKPSGAAESRWHAHYQALLAFYGGDMAGAKQIAESALAQFGDNVNLIRDLAVFNYHLSEMSAFRAGMNRLEILLSEKEKELSQESLLEGELFLGKLMEEEARLAPAALFYDRALIRAQTDLQRIRVLTQKARWQALYEPGNELSNHYRELISCPLESITRDNQVELQHALMMIELRLVGSDHAWSRIERLGEEILELDRRLLIFDFVEGALALDLTFNPKVLKKISEIKELSPYESFLWRTLKEELEYPAKIQELDALASKLSWSSYLRLLSLTANREKEATVRQELNRKIQLIVRGLDARSQALWNQRLKQALQTPEIRLELSVRTRTISHQGKTVDLSKKKIALQLLEGLMRKESLGVEEAIELLWQSSFSPEHYHRLRMSSHRLNTLVHEITGLGKIIEVDSQTVRLRPEVKLKCADAALDAEFLV